MQPFTGGNVPPGYQVVQDAYGRQFLQPLSPTTQVQNFQPQLVPRTTMMGMSGSQSNTDMANRYESAVTVNTGGLGAVQTQIQPQTEVQQSVPQQPVQEVVQRETNVVDNKVDIDNYFNVYFEAIAEDHKDMVSAMANVIKMVAGKTEKMVTATFISKRAGMFDLSVDPAGIIEILKEDVFTSSKKPIHVSPFVNDVLTDTVNAVLGGTTTIDSFKDDYYDLIDLILNDRKFNTEVIKRIKDECLEYLYHLEANYKKTTVKADKEEKEEDKFVPVIIEGRRKMIGFNAFRHKELHKLLMSKSSGIIHFHYSDNMMSITEGEITVLVNVVNSETWIIDPVDGTIVKNKL